jgi:CheY-like chemotaxis protein
MDRDVPQPFTGRRLLIVEDELLIALELQSIVEQLGGTVVGPAGSVENALQLLSGTTPDAALLDANLRGDRVTPVAQACRDRAGTVRAVPGSRNIWVGHKSSHLAPSRQNPSRQGFTTRPR